MYLNRVLNEKEEIRIIKEKENLEKLVIIRKQLLYYLNMDSK